MSKEKKTYNNLHDLYKDLGLLDECGDSKKEEKYMIEEHFKDLVSWDHKRKTLEEIENIESCNNNKIYPKPTTSKAFKKFIKDDELNEVETDNTNRVLFGAEVDLLSKFKPLSRYHINPTKFPDIHHFNISVDGYIISNEITSTIIFTDFNRKEIFRINTSSNADTVVPVYAGMKVRIFSFTIDDRFNVESKILYIPTIRYTTNTAAGDPAMDFIKEI